MPETAPLLSRRDLNRFLFPAEERPSMKTWAVLDCAQDEDIYGAILQSSNERDCLFAGHLAPELEVAAPHVVCLDEDDRLTRFLLDQGWGRAWGIYLRSDAPGSALRRHLRTFLRVTGPGGAPMLFRYYDPRVLALYLPTCHPNELNSVFGSVVHTFLCEAKQGQALLAFRREGQKLEQVEYPTPGNG
jgi:hypothetical protein